MKNGFKGSSKVKNSCRVASPSPEPENNFDFVEKKTLITTQSLHIPLKAWDRDTLMILALGIIASIWSIFGQIG